MLYIGQDPLVFCGNDPCAVFLTDKRLLRLNETCFRGSEHLPQERPKLAGNFRACSSFYHFLHQPLLREAFDEGLRQIMRAKLSNKFYRMTLKLSHPVGWESTLPLNELGQTELSQCQEQRLHPGATALFIPDNLIKAPLTNLITIAGRLNYHVRKELWVFDINTLYPGVDVGVLRGNMTDKTNRIWLHRHNRGE